MKKLFARLLRCVLILTLCLNGAISLWVSTAMAGSLVQQASALPDKGMVADNAEACDDATNPAPAGQHDHDECDCALNGCNCSFLSPTAVTAFAIPFMARHVMASEPVTRRSTHVPSNFKTAVFRPPIG